MKTLDRRQIKEKSVFLSTNDLNRFISVPPIEDGNTPSNALNQGYIYTSESIDNDYYDTEYSSPILSFNSRRTQTNVGFVYEIVVEYTVKEAPTANTPGLYGSNLIKKGDFFTVTSINDNHSYIKGAVIDILDVAVSGPFADIYTYEYNLLCNINDGDPLLMEINDNFVWKRKIYTDITNEKIKEYPINLLSTIRNDGIYFRWEDPTNNVFKYNLRVREKNVSDGGNINYFDVTGIRANGNNDILLKPFIGTTGAYERKITTIKIENAGSSYSVNPLVNVVGTGTGANVSCLLGNDGSLQKDLYRIYYADYTSGILRIQAKNHTFVPEISSYVENISKDLFIKSKTDLGNRNWEITLAQFNGADFTFSSSFADSIIDKNIIVHSGVNVLSGGNNYRKIAYTEIKMYSNEDIYVIPSGTLSDGEYFWSVCSIFNLNDKIYSEWTPETYIKIE